MEETKMKFYQIAVRWHGGDKTVRSYEELNKFCKRSIPSTISEAVLIHGAEVNYQGIKMTRILSTYLPTYTNETLTTSN